MENPVGKTGKTKDLLRAARLKAAQGDTEKAFELFQACMREYLRERMPWKALAAAKAAKTTFGGHPRSRAMLIRLLSHLGLSGDAQKEFSESSEAWMKDEVLIFRDLTMDEFTGLLEIMQLIQVRKGRYVIRQNENGSDVFIVLKGSLEVIRDGKVLAVMVPGDVFGELGFFSGGSRSAGVRALESCELIRMPPDPLMSLSAKYGSLKRSLDELYTRRILKKAGEDLKDHPLLDLDQDILATVRVPKGREIPFDSATDITIIKHGIVEITSKGRGLPVKRYLKPGYVIGKLEGTARAGTDVELIRASIDLPATGKRPGETEG
jgi:hypothetical protein